MSTIRLTLFALGLGAALMATAQSTTRAGEPAARVAELERQVAQLTQQIEQMRAARVPELRWSAAPMPFQPPPSALPRHVAVSTQDIGCPAGAICLVVRCDARAP